MLHLPPPPPCPRPQHYRTSSGPVRHCWPWPYWMNWARPVDRCSRVGSAATASTLTPPEATHGPAVPHARATRGPEGQAPSFSPMPPGGPTSAEPLLLVLRWALPCRHRHPRCQTVPPARRQGLRLPGSQHSPPLKRPPVNPGGSCCSTSESPQLATLTGVAAASAEAESAPPIRS